LGKNVVIGKNSSLRQCIILDNVKVAENSQLEYCLLEKTGVTVSIHNFKNRLFPVPTGLISKDLFEETPESEEATFQEEVQHLLEGENDNETITVSELQRIKREFEKHERDLTR
jgi:NDP-sugar pyrophosphorylase family protein